MPYIGIAYGAPDHLKYVNDEGLLGDVKIRIMLEDTQAK